MISILGCGWYGLALGKALVKNKFEVKGSTTSPNRFAELQEAGIKPYTIKLDADAFAYDADFFDCETLIVSFPPKLKQGQHNEYIAKIKQLIPVIAEQNIKQVIFISSTGVYPENNAEVDENTRPVPDSDSGKALFAAEELFRNEASFKTTIIRFGGLVGPGRHPGKFFAGKTDISNGQAPVNLIHLQDCIALTLAILQQNTFGYTFNACSTHHPTRMDFYTKAAAHAGLPAPQFINELEKWKIINSINLLQVLNYRFVINNWDDCFALNCF